MAVLTVPDRNLRVENADEIASFMEQHGLWYERWDLAKLPAIDASQEVVLDCYKAEIARLNKRGGYVTADVINVSPATPGLGTMLAKFAPEHTHSEDEVRFVVHGRGVFHINPANGPVFAIEMESGDLINVPAGTRHWFNLCEEKTIVTIRLFQDSTGWTPHYAEHSRHNEYQPLCLGPKPLLRSEANSSRSENR
jgi:1,2-dihydroxy-3-keto-5-methylthiopentene dioxygenase